MKRPAFELPQPPLPKVTAKPDVVDVGSRLAVSVVGTVGGPPVVPFPVVVIPPVNVVPPIVGAPPARPAEAPPARPPGAAPREQVPLGTGASAGGPAGASGSYRAGYNQYLRTAEVSEVAVIAVPGLAGILLLTAGGGFIGYRQAKAGHVVRAEGIGRFLQ